MVIFSKEHVSFNQMLLQQDTCRFAVLITISGPMSFDGVNCKSLARVISQKPQEQTLLMVRRLTVTIHLNINLL